jgi:FtsZ-binding cell division protein ZapB
VIEVTEDKQSLVNALQDQKQELENKLSGTVGYRKRDYIPVLELRVKELSDMNASYVKDAGRMRNDMQLEINELRAENAKLKREKNNATG